MDKRYTVFVSSTYEDLKEERHQVIQELLGIDCIPVSMEYFPAKSVSAWDAITKFLDKCDYFIMISAGVYGSLKDGKISFTEAEYNYACEIGVPAMPFLRKDLSKLDPSKLERDDSNRAKLNALRDRCQNHALCRMWDTTDELARNVLKSIHHAQAEFKRPGWVRGDSIDESAEVIGLRKRIADLEQSISSESNEMSTAELESALSKIEEIRYSCSFHHRAQGTYLGQKSKGGVINISLASIFAAIAPSLMTEGTNYDMESRATVLLRPIALRQEGLSRFNSFSINDLSLDSLIVKFKMLGLIVPSGRPKQPDSSVSYWKLTQPGEECMSKLHSGNQGMGD